MVRTLTYDMFRSRALHLASSRRSGRPSRGRLLALFHQYLVEGSQSALNETAFAAMLTREFPKIHPSEHNSLFRFVGNGSYVVSLDQLLQLLLPDNGAARKLRSRSRCGDHSVATVAAAVGSPDRASSSSQQPESPGLVLPQVASVAAPSTLPTAAGGMPLVQGTNGECDEEALSLAAEQLRRDLAKHTKRSRRRIRKLFETIDDNGNGTVGAFELSFFVREHALSAACSHHACQRLVRFFDSTNTTTLNFNDFERMLVPAAHEDHWRVSNMSAAFLHRMGHPADGLPMRSAQSHTTRAGRPRARSPSASSATGLPTKRVTNHHRRRNSSGNATAPAPVRLPPILGEAQAVTCVPAVPWR